MITDNEKNKLEQGLDAFLDNTSDVTKEEECVGETCVIKQDKSILERINKRIITEDGRDLLIG